MRVTVGFIILAALVAMEFMALKRGDGIFTPVFCFLLGFCFCLMMYI